MKELLVSIVCLTYNHEKFIRQTLEGFINQKTEFDFEVLIHDDASTDETAKIIKEYHDRYPNIIKPIFQSENQYSKRINIVKEYIAPLIKGKYVAICEGDDYWTCYDKLQYQVNVLEKNKDASFCSHIVSCVDINSNLLNKTFPQCDIKNNIITLDNLIAEEFKNEKWFLHLNSYMIPSNIYIQYFKNKPDFAKSFYRIGDLPLTLYLLSVGNCVFLPEVMSCYRMMSGGVMSKLAANKDFAIDVTNGKIEGLKKFNEYINYIYKNEIDLAITSQEITLCFLQCDYLGLRKKEYASYMLRTRKVKKILLYCIAVAFPNMLKKYVENKRRNKNDEK